ncbi:hypothetical protein CAC42_1938 [Sphaceloma murrayae]|uniref:DNA polymerase lambda n=1 Tax=Sphaceloma murrayae TaxID=2082308 RepID=A0A2K1QLZ6_9PEZI|nr:hypothetical protein CAC42_1938 [Sphaceloma murrayae]
MSDRYRQKLADYAFLNAAGTDHQERDPALEHSMTTLKRKRPLPRGNAALLSPATSAAQHGRKATRMSDKVQAFGRPVNASLTSSKSFQAPHSPKLAMPEKSTSMVGLSAFAGTTTLAAADTGKVLDGCHFYFFPNNDYHPGRKFRIRKAVEYGAVRHSLWSDRVTHLVVDRSMTYDQVCDTLRSTEKIVSIPPRVHVVSEDYPADCIAYKTLVNPQQAHYRVKGAIAKGAAGAACNDITTTEVVDVESMEKGANTASLELKPAGKDVQVQPPQTPSQHTIASTISEASADSLPVTRSRPPSRIAGDKKPSGDQHELDKAIEDARHAQDLMLSEDEADDRPSSSGSESDRAAHATSVPTWQSRFQCMHSNTAKTTDGPNAQTIVILSEMTDYYIKINDTWRPVAYRKAMNTLRNHPQKVCTAVEARKLPFIGNRLASKIEEIVFTNHLRRLENAKAEPTDQILQLFLGVYGIGYNAGMRYIAQGYKTLDDLRTKAPLTDNQRIGIDHYDDFNSRIPRAEVKEHSDVVVRAAKKVDPVIEVYTMGSYRRGATSSSDIDLVITHPTWDISKLRPMLVDTLIPRLFKQGFLRCSLAATHRLDGTKWHGASCLPNSTVWRRIDFLLVPAAELGASLIYFTGNDIFNRSMRLLASRKGMRLNQRGLYKNVMRGKGREKVTEGELVEGKDERKIFEILGVPWREPQERVC